MAVYEEAIFGLSGAAILFILQEDSKFLTDILNQNFLRNAAIPDSADYSALKELFNILSNYYVSNFSDVFDIQLLLGIPIMVDFSELESAIFKIFSKKTEDYLVAFESIFSIAANNQIKINIIFLFNKSQ